MCELAGRRLPSHCRQDEKGQLRVITAAAAPGGIVDAAFHQLRQAARANAAVTIRLLETTAAVAPLVRTPALREALLTQAAVIHPGSPEGLVAEVDRTAARERYQILLASFGVREESLELK